MDRGRRPIIGHPHIWPPPRSRLEAGPESLPMAATSFPAAVAPTTEPAVDARAALRQATSHLHAEVDASMPLALPAPGLADYHHHLRLLRAWVQALRALPVLAEHLDAEQAAIAHDIAECERLAPLAAREEGEEKPGMPDLAPLPSGEMLGEGLRDASTAAGPHPWGEAGRHDPDALAWGVRYVIEGSRLGGQVLYRRLAPALAPHPLDYLLGAGARTGARWRSFLAELQAALDTPARVAAACQGAVLAFECLLQQRRADEGARGLAERSREGRA